ncbi:MAG: hypothetical protein AVDCRST_MAG71-1058 [uncultured Lysobacter sp.]|uniref:Uncharacterized protein n=1 Tax=uncultured Lysobacter sp. TaxID=271060 RepID=A0A6J4KXV6_9GAMM|nr:MAG: hypothetical protein AVDCRST_MAG71-1058 [uncultured Lysobacter sp.]
MTCTHVRLEDLSARLVDGAQAAIGDSSMIALTGSPDRRVVVPGPNPAG